MSIDVANRELTFTIHGLQDDDREVDAAIFSAKVRDILNALKIADKHTNRKALHRYLVTGLRHGSAEMTLGERPVDVDRPPTGSSVDSFLDCMDAAYRNNVSGLRRFNGLAEGIAKVCRGAGEKFSHIEFDSTRLESPIRVDRLVSRQVDRMVAEAASQVDVPLHFRGQSQDAFDGEIKELDLRGRLYTGKLVLSGGAKEINCVFPHFSVGRLKEVLDSRVWAEGQAIYDGTSPLPVRLEVVSIRPIVGGKGIERWEGKVAIPSDVEWDTWLER